MPQGFVCKYHFDNFVKGQTDTLVDRTNAATILQKSLRAQFGYENWFRDEQALSDCMNTVSALCEIGIG